MMVGWCCWLMIMWLLLSVLLGQVGASELTLELGRTAWTNGVSAMIWGCELEEMRNMTDYSWIVQATMFKFKGLGYTPRTVTFGMKILVKEWCVCVCLVNLSSQCHQINWWWLGWCGLGFRLDHIKQSGKIYGIYAFKLRGFASNIGPSALKDQWRCDDLPEGGHGQKKHDLGMEHIYIYITYKMLLIWAMVHGLPHLFHLFLSIFLVGCSSHIWFTECISSS